MFSDWSSCALIGYYVHWLVTMPSDWSLCPLIGHHVLWLVIISYYVTSRNSIIKSKRPPYRQTDMFNILQILLHLKTYIIKFAYMGKFRWPYRSVPIPITTTYYLPDYVFFLTRLRTQQNPKSRLLKHFPTLLLASQIG